MRKVTRRLTVAGALAIALTGCGGGGGSTGTSSAVFNAHQTQGATTCGQKAVKIELHGSGCETVKTMIDLLNGRAKRSVLTIADEFGHTKWICVKPSHSLYAPLRCASDKQSFAMRFSRH
jgi:hypothetical protein